MNARPRLQALKDVSARVARPGFEPSQHGLGIVHFGVGAFHRAHQAVYTDDALAAEGGDWRIAGVSLRGTDVADALNPQNGLYTLLVRGKGEPEARLVASIDRVVAERRSPGATLELLCSPAIRIVSLTVTEKAYGIERTSLSVAPDHPAMGRDLADPRAPTGVIGVLAEALRRRRAAGIVPFTVLCCDNLPENGAFLRAGVLDFAGRTDPALREWIAEAVAFPSTMVDRITPASTEATRAEAEHLAGVRDEAAVETEPFSQWVVEDRFTAGRPAWEVGGALFVRDVAPYEGMKLRMLNGSHSLIAYAGFLSNRRFVRDAMGDPFLATLVDRHLRAAAATLAPLPGVDFAEYARALIERFGNPTIAHETYQIAMDGTEKLPQRLLAPACEALAKGLEVRPFAFAVASWMRYCLGRTDAGEPYALRDPREDAITSALREAGRQPADVAAALHALPGLFPDALKESPTWCGQVAGALGSMLEKGMTRCIEDEAQPSG